jgi:hypothetical protein
VEGADRSPINFDSDNLRDLGFQQRTREPTRTWADLDHLPTRQRAGGANNTGRQVGIEQKMLAERMSRRQPMSRDNLTKRRQGRPHRPMLPL